MKAIQSQQLSTNFFAQLINSIIGKLRQNPDVYPIRYYKKGKQFRRKWHKPLVK
jgi:hypothetical protein